jgi:endoglucanase Acf2
MYTRCDRIYFCFGIIVDSLVNGFVILDKDVQTKSSDPNMDIYGIAYIQCRTYTQQQFALHRRLTMNGFSFKWVLILCANIAMANVVQVGKGSYSSELPGGVVYPTNNQGASLSPAVSQDYAGPIPTNDWASSLVFQRNPSSAHPHPMFAHPWVIKANESGLQLGAPAGVGVSDAAFVYGTSWDITVGVTSGVNSATKWHKHSDWTVTAALFSESLLATFGHGLPYVYIEYSGNITLSLSGVPAVQNNQNGVIEFSIGDRFYGAYAPQGSTWSVNGNTLQVNTGAAGFLSIALLPENTNDTRSLFREHAYSFVTGTKVHWSYDSTGANSVARYELETTAKQGVNQGTLFALYPHQWRTVNAASVDWVNHEYQSARGVMKLARGNGFVTQTIMPPIVPIIPFAAPSHPNYQETEMRRLLQEWASKTDNELVRRHADTYWTGKDLGRLNILTQLAEQLGEEAMMNRFLELQKSRLQEWLTYTPGETNECFAYEPEWGSLIGLSASYGSGDELNDHHFHYGYFIMAAATVARLVPGWGNAEEWGGMVELIAREAANPDRHSDFTPFLRTFDIYAGHSWASGHANFGDGNNQESSSESLNFSAGLVLWGLATADTMWTNLGSFLFATEVQAVREYWFDVHDENYPANWSKNAAGMVWGGKVDYATWFSPEPEMIHGINWLPLTGASLFMGMDVEYAAANYELMIAQNGGPADQWVDITWGYRAFSNAQEAWQLYSANSHYTPEEGDSEPHIYSHILSLGALGVLDTSVRANTPASAVFTKDQEVIYTAFNPSAFPKVIRFTDGNAITVPAGSWMIVNQDDSAVTLQNPKRESLIVVPEPTGLKKNMIFDALGRGYPHSKWPSKSSMNTF